jgi:SpoIIAA-like
MPFTIVDAAGPIISAKISGELSKSEVSQLQAAALDAIKRHGKISALFILENFEGWKQTGDWGDITFMTEHDEQIGKIAVVGAEGWRDMIYAFLAKGFRNAQVEYFLPSELAKARSWLEENKRPYS